MTVPWLDNIHDYLLAQAAWVAVVGDRQWPGEDEPPADYDNEDGVGCAFKNRGGTEDYTGVILSPSIQFVLFGKRMRQVVDAAGVLRDVFDKRSSSYSYADGAAAGILRSEEEFPPQTFRDSETEWPRALVFYTVDIKNC